MRGDHAQRNIEVIVNDVVANGGMCCRAANYRHRLFSQIGNRIYRAAGERKHRAACDERH